MVGNSFNWMDNTSNGYFSSKKDRQVYNSLHECSESHDLSGWDVSPALSQQSGEKSEAVGVG